MINIDDLAKLSGLKIQENTRELFSNSINDVSNMLAILEKIDSSSVPNTETQSISTVSHEADMMRKDEHPLTEDGYFLAPKVIK